MKRERLEARKDPINARYIIIQSTTNIEQS